MSIEAAAVAEKEAVKFILSLYNEQRNCTLDPFAVHFISFSSRAMITYFQRNYLEFGTKSYISPIFIVGEFRIYLNLVKEFIIYICGH